MLCHDVRGKRKRDLKKAKLMSNQQYNTRQIPGVRLESFHSDDGVVVTAARRAQLIHRVDAVICGMQDITANQQSTWANC